jgi:protein-tyrosine phosphatase
VAWLSDRSRHGGVDEVPLTNAGTGRLFLCGKHAIGPDPEALLTQVGATTVVCLNEVHELRDRYPDYVEWLRRNQPQRAVHHPIPDLHAPDLAELIALVDDLHARLLAGEALVVQCGAGIGRSGTIAAALLMRTGLNLDDALATVRAHRPMAGPEVGSQTDVLAALASVRHNPTGER